MITKKNTSIVDLPEAKPAYWCDVVLTLERGIAIAGVTGILTVIIAVTFMPAGLALGGGAIFAIFIACYVLYTS